MSKLKNNEDITISKILFAILIILCFSISICISISLIKPWYISTQNTEIIDNQQLVNQTTVLNFDIYRLEKITMIKGTDDVDSYTVEYHYYLSHEMKKQYGGYSNLPHWVKMLISIGVFQYLSFVIVLQLTTVSIISYFRYHRFIYKSIALSSVLLTLFQIISFSIIRTIYKTNVAGLNECGERCEHFQGVDLIEGANEDDDPSGYWGGQVGYRACLGAMVLSLVTLFAAFHRYFYLKGQNQKIYLPTNEDIEDLNPLLLNSSTYEI